MNRVCFRRKILGLCALGVFSSFFLVNPAQAQDTPFQFVFPASYTIKIKGNTATTTGYVEGLQNFSSIYSSGQSKIYLVLARKSYSGGSLGGTAVAQSNSFNLPPLTEYRGGISLRGRQHVAGGRYRMIGAAIQQGSKLILTYFNFSKTINVRSSYRSLDSTTIIESFPGNNSRN